MYDILWLLMVMTGSFLVQRNPGSILNLGIFSLEHHTCHLTGGFAGHWHTIEIDREVINSQQHLKKSQRRT